MSAGDGALGIVAGIDPTGGAGLVRDVWTHALLDPTRALRCQPSAWTWQGGRNEARAQAVAPDRFSAGLRRFDAVTVLKIGLLPELLVDPMTRWIATQRERLDAKGLRLRVVYDPVLSATQGGTMGATALAAGRLAVHCDLVTPNRSEFLAIHAAWASSSGEAPSAASASFAALADTLRRDGRLSASAIEEAERLPAMARAIRSGLRAESDPPRPAWLIKSAFASESAIGDLLVEGPSDSSAWVRARSGGAEPRGTGCALATAIASSWSDSVGLAEACARASTWLAERRSRVHIGPDGRAHLSRS